jgi:hypothetical protein
LRWPGEKGRYKKHFVPEGRKNENSEVAAARNSVRLADGYFAKPSSVAFSGIVADVLEEIRDNLGTLERAKISFVVAQIERSKF